MSLPRSVTIREVAPRDGIQSLEAFIPSGQRIELVALLSQAGLAERILGRELPGQVMKAGKRSELAIA